MTQASTKLKMWLKFSIVTFLLLILIHLALPALFLFLQVPSFSIGQQAWILRWQNDQTGSGIQFNLLFLFSIAVGLSLLVTFIKTRKKRRSIQRHHQR